MEGLVLQHKDVRQSEACAAYDECTIDKDQSILVFYGVVRCSNSPKTLIFYCTAKVYSTNEYELTGVCVFGILMSSLGKGPHHTLVVCCLQLWLWRLGICVSCRAWKMYAACPSLVPVQPRDASIKQMSCLTALCIVKAAEVEDDSQYGVKTHCRWSAWKSVFSMMQECHYIKMNTSSL